MSSGFDALTGFAMAVLALTVLYVRHRVLQPVSRLVGALQALADGNLDVEVPRVGGNEAVQQVRAAALYFQDMARRSRALSAELDALRGEADAMQVRLVREIGSVIDEVWHEAAAVTSDDPAGLTGDIIGVIGGRVAGLERRQSRRLSAVLAARLEYRTGALHGVVLNISSGGARFRQDSGQDIAVGAAVRLIVGGMPSVAAEVVGKASGLASLSFSFESEAEREAFDQLVTVMNGLAQAA